MAIWSLSQLTSRINNAITDALNRQNTAALVRGAIQDVADSSLNKTDGGNVAGSITSAGSLIATGSLRAVNGAITSGGTDLYQIFSTTGATYLPAGQVAFGNALSAITGSSRFYYDGSTFALRGGQAQDSINIASNGTITIHPNNAVTYLINDTNIQYLAGTNNQQLLIREQNTATVNGYILFSNVAANSQFVWNGIINSTSIIGSSITANTAVLKSLSGTTDRMVEASSGGTISASKEIISAYITDAIAISAITNATNWNAAAVYTGATLTNVYAGQKYKNGSYLFEMYTDTEVLRLARV